MYTLVFRLVLLLLLSLPISYAQAQETVAQMEAKLKTAKDSARVDVLNDLSWEYRTNNLSRALHYAEEALKLAESINYSWGKVTAMNTLGGLHHSRSEYEKALEYYLGVIRIAEATKDRRLLAKGYNNIGSVYYKQHNLTKALEYYTTSLKIKEEINDEKSLCPSYINVAAIYQLTKDFDRAMELFLKALPIAEKNGDLKYLGIAYGNLGIAYREKGDNEKALEYYRKSMSVKAKANDMEGLSTTCLNTGALYERLRQYDSAEVYLLRTLELSTRHQLNDNRLGAYMGLTQLYIHTGKSDKAAHYFARCTELRDSIYNEQSSKKMADMLARYDADKKAKEIELLLQEQKLQAFESDRKTKEIELLNKDRAIQQYLTEQKSREVELLNKEKELQRAETQKKQKEIELLNKNYAIKESEKRLLRNSFIFGTCTFLLVSFFIYNRYRLKQKAHKELEAVNLDILQKKKEIEKQRDEIELKNKDITDSIRYAKRIQQAILPPAALVKTLIPQSFILYKPKDIVSGDFYWMESYGHQVLFAACDCTGHGVPGALMSVVGYNLLNQAVHNHGIVRPSLILAELNKGVSKALRQHAEEDKVKDGMDMSLCSLNVKTLQLEFAGANNPLWLVRDGELTQVNADKFAIGDLTPGHTVQFTNHTLQLQQGDTIYLFSDGYADQFGGEKGKKFKYKPFQKLLLSICDKTMQEQQHILNETIELWKGNLEQVDDILVIGVRV
jgi:serine phosphatase RsbU (regulator of sigma subunit)/Tfp pilus assembly protein PilF